MWISSRNKFARRVFRFAEIGDFGGYPPPPGSLKRLLGAGFTKSVCKILIAKSLEVKILKTIDLGPRRRGWLRSVRLVHDRAIVGVKARLDVTKGAVENSRVRPCGGLNAWVTLDAPRTKSKSQYVESIVSHPLKFAEGGPSRLSV